MGRLRARLSTIGDTTLTVSDLAALWSSGSQSFEQAKDLIFGSTPMKECLMQVAARFGREAGGLPAEIPKCLVLISDGEPTDGDPSEVIRGIRSRGVFVASCFVADSDVTEARRLYAEPRNEWSKAARLMFEAASTIEEEVMYRELLEARGWTVDAGARCFAQANHSETLEEFLTVAFSRAGAVLG